MQDKKIIDDGFWAFIDATNTAAAGGGVPGYRHMLERVARTMANDHGRAAVEEVFSGIAKQFASQASSESSTD